MRIDSDYHMSVDEMENNFNVQAGPGAGKTYWLVNHIKNVLRNSKRLKKTRKIVCITYTNTGVNTINERLGNYSEQVEVSTIHSFLYNNVFKPYIGFISCEYELDYVKVKGHEDVKISRSKIIEWIQNHPYKSEFRDPFTENQLISFSKNLDSLFNFMNSLKYKLNENNGVINLVCEYKSYEVKINKQTLTILQKDLLGFKKVYWKNGVISHDDLLFFSYKLLEKYPFIIRILNSKYPYFFIDEIQDTNLIQLKIIEMIAKNETVIGFIGDKVQSIYSFQDAIYNKFEEINLKDIKNYEIIGNRRSTQNIINVLNLMRRDIKQKAIRNVEGNKPVIVIGDRLEAIKKYKYFDGYELTTLSRKNITANEIEEVVNEEDLNENLEEEQRNIDGNKERRDVIKYMTLAIESARVSNFKEALNYLDKIDRLKIYDVKTKLEYLKILLRGYQEYFNKPLKDLNDYINNNLEIFQLSKISRGKIKEFYTKISYKQFAISLRNPNRKCSNITIHQSKGDEFDNVMLIKNVTSNKDLDFIINPDLENNEEHRIYYVAMSRAKENLFINIPKMFEEYDIEKLKIFFEIVFIEETKEIIDDSKK